MFFFKTIFNENPIQFFFFYSLSVTWKPKHRNLFEANSQLEAANPSYTNTRLKSVKRRQCLRKLFCLFLLTLRRYFPIRFRKFSGKQLSGNPIFKMHAINDSFVKNDVDHRLFSWFFLIRKTDNIPQQM